MSYEIKSAKDIKRGENVAVLIYSKPGIGKTSTARFLPGKTLVIDIDRTTNVLAAADNIDVVYLNINEPVLQMKKLLAWIEKEQLENYDNIFIDNISEFEKAWFGQKARESRTREGKDMGTPTMQNYNEYTYYLLDMIRYINSWEGVNKIYTAWEEQIPIESSSGQTFNMFYPEVREKTLNGLLGLMDMVGRMVKSEETGKRGFLLEPKQDTFAKNQIDNRTFALQEDLFDFGNVSNPTEQLDEDGEK